MRVGRPRGWGTGGGARAGRPSPSGPRLQQGPRGAAARGRGRGLGVANSHEDVVDEGPAAGSLQHVVDPVLQAAVALVRGGGALATGGARARAWSWEGCARRQGAAQEAQATRGAAPARLAPLALHRRERHQLGAGGVPGRGGQAEPARGGLGHGRRRAGRGRGPGPIRSGGARGALSGAWLGPGAGGAARGGRGRRGLGVGPGPLRGRGRALGVGGPTEPALTARFPGDWGGSFRLQLSYYALHAARLSTCRRRAAHMSASPAPPRPRRPRPPRGRLPKSGGSERAGEAGRREGTRGEAAGGRPCRAGSRVGAGTGPRGGGPRGPACGCEPRAGLRGAAWTRRPGWGRAGRLRCGRRNEESLPRWGTRVPRSLGASGCRRARCVCRVGGCGSSSWWG